MMVVDLIAPLPVITLTFTINTSIVKAASNAKNQKSFGY
jgi:hypothetical protein